MLEFLGSNPASYNEYRCTVCEEFFSYRAEDNNGEPTHEQPKFCPKCGSK